MGSIRRTWSSLSLFLSFSLSLDIITWKTPKNQMTHEIARIWWTHPWDCNSMTTTTTIASVWWRRTSFNHEPIHLKISRIIFILKIRITRSGCCVVSRNTLTAFWYIFPIIFVSSSILMDRTHKSNRNDSCETDFYGLENVQMLFLCVINEI